MLVIITHDVDWSRRGPGIDHILKRVNRFDPKVVRKVLEEGFNPYFGIPYIMEYEERLNVRSTFFFRAYYDDGSDVSEYRDVIKDLVRGGWEIAAHLNDASSLRAVMHEKKIIESIAEVKVVGSRAHYLRIRREDIPMLARAGFLYDSSLVYSKSGCDVRNTGFFIVDGLVELPITFMDTYLFTYDRLSEDKVIPYIENCIEKLRNAGVKLVTLLWHDCSILMRGGRVYPKLLERLAEREDIEFVRTIDAVEYILHGELRG